MLVKKKKYHFNIFDISSRKIIQFSLYLIKSMRNLNVSILIKSKHVLIYRGYLNVHVKANIYVKLPAMSVIRSV